MSLLVTRNALSTDTNRVAHRHAKTIRSSSPYKACHRLYTRTSKAREERFSCIRTSGVHGNITPWPEKAAAEPLWHVYTGRMPLVGFESIAGLLKSTPLQKPLQLHTYTLLAGPEQVWYFDFLPLRPTSPATALMLLTASSAPGEVRMKKLNVRSLKASDTARLAGRCAHSNPLGVATQYNRQYNTQLHLLYNNCWHHTEGLTSLLLAKETT